MRIAKFLALGVAAIRFTWIHIATMALQKLWRKLIPGFDLFCHKPLPIRTGFAIGIANRVR